MADNWTTVTHFGFALSNRPGELARFAAALRAAELSLMGLWGYAAGSERPVFSCVPASADAFRAFAAANDVTIEVEGEIFYLQGANDSPGALVETLQRVADSGINLDSVEAVGAGDHFGCFLWTDPDHAEALKMLLSAM